MTQHTIEIAADADGLRRLTLWIGHALEEALDADTVELLAPKIDLAVREVCTNIVEHAYGGRVDAHIAVSIEIGDEHVVVSTVDDGVEFERPSDSIGDGAGTAAGYGLVIVERLTSSFNIERVGHTNRTTLHVAIRRPDTEA